LANDTAQSTMSNKSNLLEADDPLDRPERLAGSLHVGPLNAVGLMVRQCRASHLLTCLHDDLVQTPITIERARHLRLIMHDIAEAIPDHTPPDARHITRIIDFAHDWGGHSAMVVHCFAGISRSTAAAFISLCAINPDAPEELIAQRLREASLTACPNRLMVRLADEALARRGRMIKAVERMGPAQPAYQAIPFSLSADVAADTSL
jgi:predicted protein tyrosine phosphatase